MNKVNIKTLRLAINMLRRAELDYLSPSVPKKIRAEAKSALFGMKTSALPDVCKILGINPYAATLKLLLWKAMRRVGDPLFSYLTDPSSLDNLELGLDLDIPRLQSIVEELHGKQHSTNVTKREDSDISLRTDRQSNREAERINKES